MSKLSISLKAGLDYLTFKIRSMSVVFGIMFLLAGIYYTVLGIIISMDKNIFEEQLGMGIAFIYMAAVQIPAWSMAQSHRSNISKVSSLFVWFILTVSGILLHIILRGPT
jgi:hypothetical protein